MFYHHVLNRYIPMCSMGISSCASISQIDHFFCLASLASSFCLISIFFLMLSFLCLLVSFLLVCFLWSLLGSFLASFFTCSGLFLISACTFLQSSSTDLAPLLARLSSHLLNWTLSFSVPLRAFRYLSTCPPKILSLSLGLSASGFFSSQPGNLLLEWGMKTPPSATPFSTANTLEPVEVALSPTSRITLKGLLSFSSWDASQCFSIEELPAQAVSRPTFLRSLLATSSPVAQEAAQLLRPAVTPYLLSSLESAWVKTLSPWMVADTTWAMTLVEVILTTSLYLGVLYLSLSCCTSLFLAKQSVLP